jgi:hypothetical protein
LLQNPISNPRITINCDLSTESSDMGVVKNIIISNVARHKDATIILPDWNKLIGCPTTGTSAIKLFWSKYRTAGLDRSSCRGLFAGQSVDKIFSLSSATILDSGDKNPQILLRYSRWQFGHMNTLQENESALPGTERFIGLFQGAPLQATNDGQGDGGEGKYQAVIIPEATGQAFELSANEAPPYYETVNYEPRYIWHQPFFWIWFIVALIGGVIWLAGICGGHLGGFLIGTAMFVVGLHQLTSLNRGSENVLIMPIIIAELELSNIEMQVLFADLVEVSHDAAFDQRPEAFDGLSVDGAYNVLLLVVIDGRMRIFLAKALVAGPLVGAEQADLMRDCFANERSQRIGADVVDHAGYHIALALNGADNGGLASQDATPTLLARPLVFVLIVAFAADESFVNLDNAAKLLDVLDQGCSDLVAHEPCGLVGTEAHVAHDLKRAHSLFTDQHQVRDLEPIAQWLVRVLEDRAGNVGKAIAVRGTLFALPVPLAGRQVIDRRIATTRATDALGPPAGDQVGLASIFVANREHGIELSAGKLWDGLGLFAGHDDFPPDCGRILP